MIKMQLFFVSLLGMVGTMFSQATEDWVSPDFYYGLDGSAVVTDASDNTYALSDIFYGDIYLTKRDTEGTILWTATYDNTESGQWEMAGDVAIDVNGDAIVTGYTNTGFGSEWYPVQMVTMKFSGVDGALLWRKTYATDVKYRGRKLLTDASGNIYVGGDTNAWMIYHGEVGTMMVKKYDTDGNDIWTINEDAAGNDFGGTLLKMQFAPDGNIVIGAYGTSLAKITTAGTVLWHTSGITNGLLSFDIDPSGNIFTATHGTFGTPPFISTDFVVKKFNSSGTLLWSNNYDFGNEEFSRQIICDNTGGAYITGYGDLYFDWYTFKVDASGVMLWSQTYDEHTGNDEIPKMMVKDDYDNIYITGQGGPWPGYFWLSLVQMVTIKYTPAGVEEWVALHTDYSNTGSAICLASDNSIYALGQQYAVLIHYNQVMDITCATPSGLFTNNITNSQARFNWTHVPGAVQYEVWYKKATGPTWKVRFVDGTKNKLNVKGLQAEKNYVWKIRTICADGLVSDFSTEQPFTTLPLREGEITSDITVNIYPNPARDILYVQSDATGINSITIIDLSGQVVLTSNEITDNGTDISNLASGVYIIRIETESEIINQQFVISK
jgi:hypothetical protein